VRRRKGASQATHSQLVLGTFSSALTILPCLHTLNHRDDHVHVDGAIVLVGHDHYHDHRHHEHVGVDDGEEDDEDDHEDGGGAQPGVDHPDHHHGPHARGALAHGAAFILANAIYVLPPPALALERLPVPSLPDSPASGKAALATRDAKPAARRAR
jgi:hypothetical protein